MSLLQFLKKWTLPVAIAMGVALYVPFAFLPPLEPVGTWLSPFFDDSLPVLMFAVLFVTFCKVDFRKMTITRWHWWILGGQLLLLLVATALILTGRYEGENLAVMESMLCCLIAPCATASPIVTSKLGGSLEGATAYTFLSNLVMAFLIPVIFPLVNPAADVGFFSAFFIILKKICMVLLMPMLLAHFVKRYLPRFHGRIIAVRDLSFYLWAVCLAIVVGATVRNIVHAHTTVGVILLIAGISLLTCLLQFAAGKLIGHRLGYSIECGQAFGQKNTSFAIWIACAYLIPLSSLGPGCYILWQNIFNSWELAHDASKKK